MVIKVGRILLQNKRGSYCFICNFICSPFAWKIIFDSGSLSTFFKTRELVVYLRECESVSLIESKGCSDWCLLIYLRVWAIHSLESDGCSFTGGREQFNFLRDTTVHLPESKIGRSIYLREWASYLAIKLELLSYLRKWAASLAIEW